MVHLIRAAVVPAALLVSVLAGAQDRISVRQVKDEFNLQIGVMSSLYDGFGNYSRTGYAPDLYDLYEPYSLSPSYSPVRASRLPLPRCTIPPRVSGQVSGMII